MKSCKYLICLSNKNNQIQRPEADTIGVLRNFAKFTGTIAQVFLVNFVKFLKAPFLQNTSGRLLLIVVVLSHFELFVKQSCLKKNCFLLKTYVCLLATYRKGLIEKAFCLQKARGKWFFLLQALFFQNGIFE